MRGHQHRPISQYPMRELGPGNPRARVLSYSSVIHAAHSATRHGRCRRLLLWQLGHHGFCGDEQASNRGGILQRRADHLGRIDDTFGHEVAELALLSVVTVRVGIFVLDLPDYDRTVLAGVYGDLACGPGNCLLDHLNAVPLIFILALEVVEDLASAEQSDAASGKNAFLDGRTGRVHSVVDAILALLHLHLGGAADANHRDATRELREAFLQLLAVVFRGGLFNLRLDLGDAPLNICLLTSTADDRGILLVDHHFLGAAEHADCDVLEFDTQVRGDPGAAAQNCDVLEPCLSAIAEAGRLYGRNL